jgi:hypothetical protein
MKASNMLSRAVYRAATVVAIAVIVTVSASATYAAGAVAPARTGSSAVFHAVAKSNAKKKKPKEHKKKKKKKKKKKTPTTSGGPAQSGYTVQSVTPWKYNASPVGWSSSLNRVIYNSHGADGLFNAYSANPDGSDPECLTCTLPDFPGVGTGTNRGASDVSPNGQYMLVTVEEPVHAGEIGASWTEPGAGGANNVWLYSTNGQQAWPLTSIASAGPTQAYGTIWPRFDHTGNEIVWASMYSPALADLGYWTLKVANIVWSDGVPSLADIRTIEPAADTFYEPYGFTPNDQGIIFASNDQEPSLIDDQIDTISTNGTGLTHLTEPNQGTVVNYNEFAWYTPNENSIIYGSTLDATSGGMDFWTMNPNGTDRQRLTYFNEPWDTESLGYSIVESLAFNPKNSDQFIAAVSSDVDSTDVNAYSVSLEPSWKPYGLTERFYNGQSFGQLLSATTQNPSDGFFAPASPAPGVPTTDYSIRWSGAVIPPSTGTYTFCIVAQPSAQLLVRGQELINGSDSYGTRKCATASATANRSVPIELDYEHGVGPAYVQLSWIPPGGSTPTLIPTTAMATAAPVTAVSQRERRTATITGQDGRHH